MQQHSDPVDPLDPLVLLVDDDPVSLVATEAALQLQGFRTHSCASAEAALQVLLGASPLQADVLLLDARMPGMDGFALCQRLRQAPSTATLPVMMLTALDDEASIERAYEAGANEFFVKSGQWLLLARRLRYLLRNSRLHEELLQSRQRLARAQRLARMGSFVWPLRAGAAPQLSDEALEVLNLQSAPSSRQLLACLEASERELLLQWLREGHTKPLVAKLKVQLPDGRQRVLHVEAEAQTDAQGLPLAYAGILQDVTERQDSEDRIRRLALFDTLTGLPNRRQLILRAERAVQAAQRHGHSVALLLMDLDRFKTINDTLGHAAGDELLVEVASRLRDCVRHSEPLLEALPDPNNPRAHRTLEGVGRLGGDEFVALLPEVASEAEAHAVAQRMLAALREPIHVGGQDCFVSCSIGVTLFPRDGSSMAELLRTADLAMYSVKDQGRNAVGSYAAELSTRKRERLQLEGALHRAIERQELVLHYQPKLDVAQARLAGVEALMRWQRDGQLVSPAEFIPLAEETGLILPMSQWALREAARQAAQWQLELGWTPSIAVNLPSRMFERPELIELLHASVREQGVPHRVLQLEITESGLMKDLQRVLPMLQRLGQLGIDLSVDDFGTGYSSLAYLASLPLAELKIDRSFVRELGRQPQSGALVSAIMALAQSLGLRVVAEGVETLRQMQVLQRQGCQLMQGFLFARPMPAEALAPWWRDILQARRADWITAATLEHPRDAARPLRAGLPTPYPKPTPTSPP